MGNIERGKLLYREMKVDHANVHENIYKFNQKTKVEEEIVE